MRDEMQRTMKELKLKDYAPPFFVSFAIQDNKSFVVSASLGALVQSNIVPQRQKSSVRILVGDYELNDESIDDNLFSQPKANEINLPLDDDYLGIRRALWVTADVVYRNAAVQSQKNSLTLKQKNKTLDEVPHRTFAKTPPVTNINTDTFADIKIETLEDYVRKASAIFRQFPEIENSGVVISCSQGYNYLVNSEGTQVKKPQQFSALLVTAQLRNGKGEFFFDAITHLVKNPNDFLDMNLLEREIKSFVGKLIEAQKISLYKDDYFGPVLFLGKSVASTFAESLFSPGESLMATNDLEKQDEMDAGINKGINSKIDKLVVNESIRVSATPKLDSFAGVDLLGSFSADTEGVVPPDELVLIEKGVLKNLLNDRSLIRREQTANGHSGGPGVIQIFTDNGVPLNEMKKILLAEAKKEGLEYAYFVSDENNFGSPIGYVTKINVADGKEQIYRGAAWRSSSMRSLKKLEASSKERKAYNLPGRATGKVISFIVPEAILLGNFEIREGRGSMIRKEEDYVVSPLKLEKK